MIKTLKEIMRDALTKCNYKAQIEELKALNEKLSMYTAILEQHVDEKYVVPFTGERITDRELNARVLVLGSHTNIKDVIFLRGTSQTIVVHPKAKHVSVSNIRFLRAEG